MKTLEERAVTASPHRRPTFEELHARFIYDPESGALARRKPYGSRRITPRPGKHLQVRCGTRAWNSHILIWVMMTGKWPKKTIDHCDRNRINNRWNNLRLATQGEQTRNRGITKHSKSGVKGVNPVDGKWIARIRVNGTVKHLGRFNTLEEAAAAYKAGAETYYGEFACASRNPEAVKAALAKFETQEAK